MGALLDLWSVPRRAVMRTGEFVSAGALADMTGLIPQFNEMYGQHAVFYTLVSFAIFMLYDTVEIALRPELWPPPCVDEQQKLPFEEEK